MGIENGDKISDLNPLWPLGTDPVSQGDDQIRLIKNVMVNDALGKSEGGTISADLTVDGDLTVDNITASDGLDITGDTSIDGDLSFTGTISPPYPIVANPNILINPSFTVKQRGDVIDHNNTTFGPDRWRVSGINNVGGTMSQSTTVTDPTTGINKLLVKHRNATDHAYTFQPVEAVNLLGLYGKDMTFSFSYSDTGGSGIPKAEILSWDFSAAKKTLYEAIPTSLGDNRWTCTFTLSTADGTIPDSSERGMEVLIYPNEENTAPAEWYLWETKLEVGSVATPFIARSYGEELALCQRYYQKHTQGSSSVVFHGYDNSTQRDVINMLFPVEFRANPTVTLVSYSVNNNTGSPYPNLSSPPVVLNAGQQRVSAFVETTNQPSDGARCNFQWTAHFDAEI